MSRAPWLLAKFNLLLCVFEMLTGALLVISFHLVSPTDAPMNSCHNVRLKHGDPSQNG